MPKNISKKILDKIKEKKIHPKPKWEFLLKKYVLWSAFGLSVIIGGIAVSVTIFTIRHNDWDIAPRLGQNTPSFLIETIPYFWIIIFLAFLGIAYYNFKHTSEGYKFRLPATAGISLLLSVILGFAFFGAGIAKKVDERALKHLPFYQQMTFDKRAAKWMMLEKGLLGGKIQTPITPEEMGLLDMRDQDWTIEISRIPLEIKQKLKEDMPVGILGQKKADFIFEAEQIRPWKGNFMPKMQKMKENLKPMRNR